MIEKFTITDEHLKLIPHLNWSWEDEAYEGAPCVDLKRPYGNSQPYADIAEIIEAKKIKTDDEAFVFVKGTKDKCKKLHEEMKTVLEICCQRMEFKTGLFYRKDYWDKWEISTVG